MEATLRVLHSDDSALILPWLQDDQEGLETFFGIGLPDAETLSAALSLLDHQSVLRLVELGGELAGMVVAQASGVVHIYVHPRFRGASLRVGKLALEEAKHLGLKSVVGCIKKGNKPALALARALGFKEHQLDYVVMLKELD